MLATITRPDGTLYCEDAPILAARHVTHKRRGKEWEIVVTPMMTVTLPIDYTVSFTATTKES